MPPRYAYWTILIDNGATAFRAKEQSELLPTLNQLRRTNKDVVMKWFSNGRLWESPDEARRAREERAPRERRGHDWRPGGQHKDPRARFTKPKGGGRAPSEEPRRPRAPNPRPAAPTSAKAKSDAPPSRGRSFGKNHAPPSRERPFAKSDTAPSRERSFRPRRPQPQGRPGPPRRR